VSLVVYQVSRNNLGVLQAVYFVLGYTGAACLVAEPLGCMIEDSFFVLQDVGSMKLQQQAIFCTVTASSSQPGAAAFL